jgi:CRP/FNR family nitrogen fixation transcriptional regulator
MHDEALALRLWTTTAAHLQRAQCHLSVLGRGTAAERVATFLLEMQSRLRSSDSIQLPMPRRDIADYLGLTIETVSRMFHLFQRRRLISIPEPRRIVLRNPEALQRMSDA